MAEAILDWLMENVLSWFLLALIAAVVIGLPLAVYAMWVDSKSPTMNLRKSDWVCTQSERVPITTYVNSGNVMVPITTYDDRCNQWNRQP